MAVEPRGQAVPWPCCQLCVSGASWEQSNHSSIVLAFVIKDQAAGTCWQPCRGTGRKPSAAGGGCLWQPGRGGHRGSSTGRGTYPGSSRAPSPPCFPSQGCLSHQTLGCAAAVGCTWGSPLHPVSCCCSGKEQQCPELPLGHPRASPGHPTASLALLARSVLWKSHPRVANWFVKGLVLLEEEKRSQTQPLLGRAALPAPAGTAPSVLPCSQHSAAEGQR